VSPAITHFFFSHFFPFIFQLIAMISSIKGSGSEALAPTITPNPTFATSWAQKV
jgi:hypothetical protein